MSISKVPLALGEGKGEVIKILNFLAWNSGEGEEDESRYKSGTNEKHTEFQFLKIILYLDATLFFN